MLFANWFGDGLVYILVFTIIAGILYRRLFPQNEPGETVKRGFLMWLAGRFK